MTITFENENDVIVYALEKIITYAKHNQYIFLAQRVWWIASVLGLQAGLVIHIDNIRARLEIAIVREDGPSTIRKSSEGTKMDRQDKMLREYEEYLQDSRRLHDLETLKATGKSRTGQIHPLASLKESLRIARQKKAKDYSRTEGIEATAIERRKGASECLCCAWPPGQKGSYRVKDCVRKIRIAPGTALSLKTI
jgi:hypothetical protein